MNTTKMRKQVARQTPDRISKTFTTLDPGAVFKVFAWQEQWKQQMKLKHGKNFDATVTRYNGPEAIDRVTYVLQAHPLKELRYGI